MKRSLDGQGDGRYLAAMAVAVVIATSSRAAETAGFERRAIPFPQGIWAVDAVDANGDGRRDMIVVGDSRVWAVLAPRWEVVELAHTPGGRTIHAVSLDCDADGDLDVCLGRSASFWIHYRTALAGGKRPKKPGGADFTVAWLENPGRTGPATRRGSGERSEGIARDSSGGWLLHVLDRELHGVHGLWTGDVNGDGAPDLIADSFAGPHLESSLAWFPAPTKQDPRRPMVRRMITTGKATGRPHYMDFADLDRDGRGDVLLGASTEGTFTWWRQPKDLSQAWSRHVIADAEGATHPRVADLNADGRLDVIGSAGHGPGVYWFGAPQWKRHVIDDDIRDVHAFDAADLDDDGDVDAAGCSFSQGIVRWWENLGGGRFRRHDVDTENGQQAYDVKLTDLDGDGRTDILLAGRRSDNAVWYRNVGAAQRGAKR